MHSVKILYKEETKHCSNLKQGIKNNTFIVVGMRTFGFFNFGSYFKKKLKPLCFLLGFRFSKKLSLKLKLRTRKSWLTL